MSNLKMPNDQVKFLKLPNERRIVVRKKMNITVPSDLSDPKTSKLIESNLYMFLAVKETIEMLIQKVELTLSSIEFSTNHLNSSHPLYALKNARFEASNDLKSLLKDAIIDRPSSSGLYVDSRTRWAFQLYMTSFLLVYNVLNI